MELLDLVSHKYDQINTTRHLRGMSTLFAVNTRDYYIAILTIILVFRQLACLLGT